MRVARPNPNRAKSEVQLLREIHTKLDGLEVKIDAIRTDAAKTGAVAGAVAGGVAGGIVATAIAFIRAQLGL